MNVDRKELLTALKRAFPGVENGNPFLEGSDTFIFSDGFIHTYNDSISVSVPFVFTMKDGSNVSGALKAKDFYDLISRYAEGTLKIIPKDTIWSIKSENATAELTLLESGLLERVKGIIPTKIKWASIPKRFIEGIKLCSFTSNKSVLSGVHINRNVITSTDEIRINWYELDEPFSKDDSVWISDDSVASIIKLENISKYAVSPNWIHFQTEDGTIFSCKRLAQDKYPYSKLVTLMGTHKQEKTDIGNELPAKLLEAIRRASTLSQNVESFETIKLTLETDSIEVFAQRSSGKYTEKLEWTKPFKKAIEPISIFVDFSMVENAMKYSKVFYLKNTKVKDKIVTRIIFTHEHGMQLVSTFEGNV